MQVKNYYEKLVQDKLYEIYGPTPPIECVTRVFQELKFMRGKRYFQDLGLICALKSMAYAEGIPLFLESYYGSSFVAWLLGASRINPLPPHRYCPRCHKIEFFYDEKDCWNLRSAFCCGEEMKADGHNIPFDSISNNGSDNGFYLSFQISDSLLDRCIEIAHEYYRGAGLQIVPVHPMFMRRPEKCETAFALIPDNDEKPPLDTDGLWHPDDHEFYEKGYKTIEFRPTAKMNEIAELSQKTEQRPDLDERSSLNSLKDVYDELILEYPHFTDVPLSTDGSLDFSSIFSLFAYSHGLEDWGPEEIALFKKNDVTLKDLFTTREDVINEILSHSSLYYGDGRSFAFDVMEKTRKGIYAHRGIPEETVRLLQDIGVPEHLIAQIMKTQYLPLKDEMLELILNYEVLSNYRCLVEYSPKEVS